MKTQVQSKTPTEKQLGVVMHSYDSSDEEVKAERSLEFID